MPGINLTLIDSMMESIRNGLRTKSDFKKDLVDCLGKT